MKDILTRAFWLAFFTTTITEFTQIGALLIDGVITSKCLGENAIAAVGIAGPFFFLVGILSASVAAGLQTVCAREMGRGQIKKINAVINETLLLTAAVSILFSLVVFLTRPLSRFCSGPEETRQIFWGIRNSICGALPWK